MKNYFIAVMSFLNDSQYDAVINKVKLTPCCLHEQNRQLKLTFIDYERVCRPFCLSINTITKFHALMYSH